MQDCWYGKKWMRFNATRHHHRFQMRTYLCWSLCTALDHAIMHLVSRNTGRQYLWFEEQAVAVSLGAFTTSWLTPLASCSLLILPPLTPTLGQLVVPCSIKFELSMVVKGVERLNCWSRLSG
jgi:hypothetical protein